MAMTILREAGHNEHRTIIRDALGLYGVVVVTAVYHTARPAEQMTAEHMKNVLLAALANCIKQHPALSSVPVDFTTEKPQYARPSSIDLLHHLNIVSDAAANDHSDSMERFLAVVHNVPVHNQFDVPPWKLHIKFVGDSYDSFFAAFAFSHALSDGVGGIAFHRSFLAGLDMETFNDPALTTVPTEDIGPLLPAMESAGAFTTSLPFLLTPLLGTYLPKSVARMFKLEAAAMPRPPQNKWTARDRTGIDQNAATAERVKTAVVVQYISAATLSGALARCRQMSSPGKEVRLTALLQQLLARAILQSLHNQDAKEGHALVGSIALDMRRALDGAVPADAMTNCTSVLSDVFTPDEATLSSTDALWTAARHKTALLSQRASTPKDQPVGLLKFLSNKRTWMLSSVAKAPGSSFEQSNLGVFKSERAEDSWNVERAIFSQSADATGAPLVFNVVSVPGGELVITATWRPEWLGVGEDEREFVEAICRRIVQSLESVAAGQL